MVEVTRSKRESMAAKEGMREGGGDSGLEGRKGEGKGEEGGEGEMEK